jgi:hypothetical protein
VAMRQGGGGTASPVSGRRAMGGAGGWTAPEVDEEVVGNDNSDSESESADEPHGGRRQGSRSRHRTVLTSNNHWDKIK